MKLLVALLPRSRRDWGRALLAEAAHADNSLRWMFGGIRLVGWSWFDWMIGGNLMKSVVVTLSTVNVAMGLFLMGLLIFTGSRVPVVLMLAIGLIVQGGYTLWYVSGRMKTLEPWAIRSLLVAQTVAILVGAGGFVMAILNNINPPGGDYEYGPIAVSGLIAAQAAATLYLYAIRNNDSQVEVQTST